VSRNKQVWRLWYLSKFHMCGCGKMISPKAKKCGPCARKRELCRRGHSLTDSYVNPNNGGRYCRICHQQRSRSMERKCECGKVILNSSHKCGSCSQVREFCKRGHPMNVAQMIGGQRCCGQCLKVTRSRYRERTRHNKLCPVCGSTIWNVAKHCKDCANLSQFLRCGASTLPSTINLNQLRSYQWLKSNRKQLSNLKQQFKQTKTAPQRLFEELFKSMTSTPLPNPNSKPSARSTASQRTNRK
jgi:hypothetical protein